MKKEIFEMSEPPIEDIDSSPKIAAGASEDPDLEDGEIDDDDDEADVLIVNGNGSIANDKQQEPILAYSLNKPTKVAPVVAVDLVNEADTLPSSTKSKKQHIEDDHASSIENAIASALKKKGIEPPMPKLLETRSDPDSVEVSVYGQSRSSRRRKRKRQRDELEKERKDKKRMNMDSPEFATQTSVIANTAPAADEDDMDDYEMLNVRGGSPPTASNTLIPTLLAPQKYDSQDEDSCNSYDSYMSQHRYEGRRGNKSKESRKSRRERARGREDRDERNGRNSDKKNRRDSQSEDSKHRQEPRKLELCKFYLMECCAKKEKCSYMHSDFPCKYYYLGMDCVYGDLCKFSHGRPLTEQLRNILLKHLETAPKEILGAFKRICRDTAVAQMATRHVELCKTFGVENNLVSLAAQNVSSGRSGSSAEHHHQQHVQQQHVQHQPQIPSLLDIIIKPPTPTENSQLQKDKQRKSRWCDNNSQNDISSITSMNEQSLSPPMELKTMTGLVNAAIIEKLSQVGVVNLEQVNQLRFGQLAKIGLTIGDISELQMNAHKVGKLVEVIGDRQDVATDKSGENKMSAKGDVDMRLIPSVSNSCIPSSRSYTTNPPDVEGTECSNSNSNSSTGGVVLVDYSQYLKDSNLSFDRGDLFDDEKDEEQLVIDDELDAAEETAIVTDKTEIEDTSVQDITNTVDLQMKFKNNERNTSPIPNKNLINPLYNQTDDVKEQRDPRSKTSSAASASFIEKFKSFGSTYNTKTSPGSPDVPVYERPSMYDYNPKYADEDKKSKADKDMRLNSFSFPFQPAPATEIDASINSHLPIQWKLYEVDVPRYSYGAQSFTSNQTIDPRVRRILQLPELPKTNTAAALSHGRMLNAFVASPENAESPSSYYTPQSNSGIGISSTTPVSSIYSTQIVEEPEQPNIKSKTTNTSGSRLDPRRGAASGLSYITKTTSSSVAQKQNVEIRNLLQKSDWYKNLSSTSKIMVNQQIALVSTELKKFHQDSSPDKVFSSQIIMSNPTLQQILTSLGIYIDYNGEVKYLDIDNAKQIQCIGGNILTNLNQMPPNIHQDPYIQQQQKQLQCTSGNIIANMNQMPPVPFMQQQLEFLRGPPPAIPPQLSAMQYMPTTAQQIKVIPPFAVGPPPPDISRPSLLGMPPLIAPVGNPFNQPFSNILSCPRLPMMGSAEFGNLRGMQQQNMQRNFGNQRHNRNSRQNNH